jgi:hypothetical protein
MPLHADPQPIAHNLISWQSMAPTGSMGTHQPRLKPQTQLPQLTWNPTPGPRLALWAVIHRDVMSVQVQCRSSLIKLFIGTGDYSP